MRHHIKKWIESNLLNGDTISTFIAVLNSESDAVDKISTKLAEVLFSDLQECKDDGYLWHAIVLVSPMPGWIKRPTRLDGLCEACTDYHPNLEDDLLHAFEKDGGVDYRTMVKRIYSDSEDLMIYKLVKSSEEWSRDGVADDVLSLFPKERHDDLVAEIDKAYDEHLKELRASDTE